MSAWQLTAIDLEESARRDRELPRDAHFKKMPEDLARYERVLGEVKPSLVIETGTWHGASAAWFVHHVPYVITIDSTSKDFERLSNVFYLHGSSIDARAVNTVAKSAFSLHPVLVSLDSAHDAAHVLEELDAYAQFVTVGSYLVVEDTIHHWREPGAFPIGGDPWEALEIWQPEDHGFEVAADIEAMSSVTANPGGWLRRVR